MSRKKMPCNEDCFNCIYPDCIYDGLGRETRAPDSWEKGPIIMDRWKRAYYQAHKEEINAKRAKRAKEKRAAKATAEAVNNNSIL